MHKFLSWLTNDRRWLALWLLAIVTAGALVAEVGRRTAAAHLERAAAQSGLQYAELVASAVPDLAALFAEGRPSAAALSQLRRMRRVGDVFRFKMFDREGRLILTSDQLDAPNLGADGALLGDHHGERSQTVTDIVLGGRTFVELKDGRGRADRPAVFSEAYVPVHLDGRLIGVVEAYVDQATLQQDVRRAFLTLGAAIGAVLLGLGGLGAWQALVRQRAQREADERVRYLARHDVLSGALNRASFDDVLRRAAWRHGAGGGPFAVLCLDLDRFKEVNDSLGHAAGDDVLRQATARLRTLVRHGDELARLGGDEFAIVQSSVASPADVRTLAQRVVECLSVPFEVAGQRVLVGASVGAAIFGSDASNTVELMHKADLALYRAKANGRGTFSFYDSALDEQLQVRRELTRDLREAIAAESLTLHYQKLFDADGVTLTGYEALLRWAHPTRGNVPPDEFIPLAEDTGMIVTLGSWVLRRACREAAGWPAALTIAVNLSAAQFRHGDLVGTVTRALADSGLAPHRLELEITESMLMADTDKVVQTLHTLSALGVRIAMDDFGTGYSSLAYLWRFPFDKLKIDKAFTHALSDDPKVNLIVRSIVSLAHSLHIRVNAEGVETAAQMRLLQKHGCDELQGFLLGRPAGAETLVHAAAAVVSPPRAGPSDETWAGLPTLPAAL